MDCAADIERMLAEACCDNESMLRPRQATNVHDGVQEAVACVTILKERPASSRGSFGSELFQMFASSGTVLRSGGGYRYSLQSFWNENKTIWQRCDSL